jgi:hypothetical protein
VLRRRTWPVLLWLGALTALLLWITLSHLHPLWPGAIRLDLTHGIITNNFIHSGYDFVPHHAPSWFWNSNSNLIHLARSGPGIYHTINLDLHPIRLQQFTHDSRPTPSTHETALVDWAPSPNGRWILKLERRGATRFYTASTFDGQQSLSWTNRYEGRTPPEWISDSTGFVDWPVRDNPLLAHVYWLNSPTTHELTLDDLPARPITTPALPQPFVLMRKQPHSPGTAAELLILSPRDHPAAWHRAILPTPTAFAAETGIQTIIAPTGDWFLWLRHKPAPFPKPAFHPGFPYLSFHSRDRTTLLLSRPNGSQLHILGRTTPGRTIDAARWAPDGRRFAFVYDDSLWLHQVAE